MIKSIQNMLSFFNDLVQAKEYLAPIFMFFVYWIFGKKRSENQSSTNNITNHYNGPITINNYTTPTNSLPEPEKGSVKRKIGRPKKSENRPENRNDSFDT